MKILFHALLASGSLLVPTALRAADMPPAVDRMIRAAAASGDPGKLATVADLAKQTNPDSGTEIDALVKSLNDAKEQARIAKLEKQDFFDGWRGQGEAGASVTTGNSKSTGLSLGLGLNKEGLRWRHALTGAVDYLRSQGQTEKQRYFVGYQGDYKFSDRAYALGLLSWERDRFAGFTRRYSEAIGIGYSVVKTPSMTLNLEAGPALRQTRYISGLSDNELAGRAALDYRWAIRSGVSFTENASLYAASGDSTLTSTTALDFKLGGALSARASLLVEHESDPPPGLDRTNTTSRLTLVYGF